MKQLALFCSAVLLSAGLHAPAAAPERLRIQDTRFVHADGSPFQWRGITAFRLLDYVAAGQEDRAVAFLRWATSQRLTVVRVFAMLHGFFELPAARGRAALPRLLTLAAAQGLYVEIVGLTTTAAAPVDPAAQISELGRIASRHDNALLELANEPYHPTQSADVHQPVFLGRLASSVPAGIPVSLGSIEEDAGFASGTYATWHVPRRSGEAGWGHVLAIADGAVFPRRLGKPVISDEPIGAGPRFEPGRRDDEPDRFRAAALLTRLAGLGATFHYEGGLHARVPEGKELACFAAWNEAWSLLPGDVERRGVFRKAGETGAAVRGFQPRTALAVFERQDAGRAWVLVVRPASEPRLRWASGWKPRAVQRAGGVQVIEAVRTK